MKKTIFLMGAIALSVTSHVALAAPTVNGNTISWPASGWYQVQRATAQNGNPVSWDLCNSNVNGTSCAVPAGVYRVNRQGGNPWKVLEVWDNVEVKGGNTSNTGTKPTVSGSTISWPSSGWYQVQRTSVQNGYGVDWNVCSSSKNGTSCTVPNGTYRVNRQGGNPWTVQEQWDDIVVGGLSEYQETFFDDFNGNTVSTNFAIPTWNVPNRDAVHNKPGACAQSDSRLLLSIKQVGNERLACYLISKRKDFGPGEDSTLKIEYRANGSQVKAKGAWLAGWMFAQGYNANGVDNGADGDAATGMEIDVFEYLPAKPTEYNYAIHDKLSRKNERFVNTLTDFGADLRKDEFHTYSIEWNKNCIAFYFDGKPIGKETQHVSRTKNHSIFLTMEAQTGVQWGFLQVGSFENNLRTTSALGQIDWVRVSTKRSIDSGLCNF